MIRINKLISVLAISLFFACTPDEVAPKEIEEKETVIPQPAEEKEETLAESLLGTYESEMDVVKAGAVRGKNLPLYVFVTPVEGNPNKVRMEIRRWSGDFMPHLLSFSGTMTVEKESETKVKITGDIGIPYSIEGMDGLEKEGTVSGSFTLGEKPTFDVQFYVMSYDMTVRGLNRKTKTVLPKAISNLD